MMNKNPHNKDESVIPKGDYCYDDNGRCPYWRKIKDRPEMENGWCDFLETGDVELNQTKIYTNQKTGEQGTANELGLPLALLWDECKECMINYYSDEEWDELIEKQKEDQS